MRKRYILLFLLILTGLSLQAVKHYTSDVAATEQADISEPDYYGKGLKSVTYNAKGDLTETFFAAESVHYPDKQEVKVTQPKLITLDAKGEATTLTALRGRLSEIHDRIELEGDVEVISGSISAPVLLQTDSLHYDNQTQIAQTDKKVRISDLNSVTEGTGMIYDLSQQSVELLSGVRSRYVPTSAPQQVPQNDQ